MLKIQIVTSRMGHPYPNHCKPFVIQTLTLSPYLNTDVISKTENVVQVHLWQKNDSYEAILLTESK